MKHHTIPKQVADPADSAQNWTYEADIGISGSRQSGEGVGQSDRKKLVRLHLTAAGQEIAGLEEVHGFLEKEKARQIFKAFASSAGSSPRPSARIAPIKSSSFFKCKISRNASSRSFLNFSAAESLGRRPLRRSSFIRDEISSSLRSSSMLIKRYSNSFLSDPPVRGQQSSGLTLTQARRYTVVSRWECGSSRRASCHSTRRSFGLPSGICELHLTFIGSLLPPCAAPRTYEYR